MSWTPFCQLWNFHGPFETGIELLNVWFMSWPLMMWAGYGLSVTTDCQSAYADLKTTVPDLPLQVIGLDVLRSPRG